MPTGFVHVGFGMGQDPNSRIVNPIVSLTLYDMDGNEIGYVTRIVPSSTRTVTRQRHLNAHDAGRVVELSIAPTDYSLTVEGFALYTPGYPGLVSGSLIDRLFRPDTPADAVFNLLMKQTIPFNLIEEIKHPSTGNGTRTKYLNCIVNRWQGARQITQAWIAESVDIVVAHMEVEPIEGE